MFYVSQSAQIQINWSLVQAVYQNLFAKIFLRIYLRKECSWIQFESK